MSLHMSHAHERMDYHVPEDDPDSSRVPKVAISTQEPFRILHASGEWLDLFQFSREEIIGRNLRMICGPATNIMGLKRVVETAVMAKEGQTALSLYSRAGTGAHLSVKASCRDDPTGEVCTLSMSLSDAVPLKDALQCEDGPCAIISAEPPHLVEQVNMLFCSQFGCILSVVLHIRDAPSGTDTGSATSRSDVGLHGGENFENNPRSEHQRSSVLQSPCTGQGRTLQAIGPHSLFHSMCRALQHGPLSASDGERGGDLAYSGPDHPSGWN